MSRNKVAKLKREIFFLAENGKRRTLFGGEENHLTFSGTFPLGWLTSFVPWRRDIFVAESFVFEEWS